MWLADGKFSPEVNEAREIAKHYHTLSSWVGSGDETHVDLDHMEPFHLIVWKLYEAVELMHKFAKVSTLIIPLSPTELWYVWLSYHTKVFTYTVLGMYPGVWLRVYFILSLCARVAMPYGTSRLFHLWAPRCTSNLHLLLMVQPILISVCVDNAWLNKLAEHWT